MDVQRLTVGPIVGYTSGDQVRIFGRAELSIADHRPRKAHGVIRYKKRSNAKYSSPIYFKMNPNFDLTGVIVIPNLDSNTKYEYQVGWFFSDLDTTEINVKKILNWQNIESHQFKTASTDTTAKRNIVFGSCRYALRLFGGMWWDDRGDRTFRSILTQIDEGKEVDQVIMCGDQIYADDLNFVGADTCVDEFNSRYRAALNTPHIRKLMSCTPTYMILDDHEIEDNWPSSANKKDWVTKFPSAIHAYTTYQASHSPLFSLKNNRITGTPTHLWYSYQDGCCDFFICDTRTERDISHTNKEIIGPRQMTELLSWLNNGNGQVKVIVTSVPPYESESEDKWHGFINQRDEIFECINSQQIPKVLFLSGDVHACMASQVKINNDIKVTSIVSSAFFWPYPHPNRKGFKLSGVLDTTTTNEYKVENASEVYPEDAFTRLCISTDKVKVEFYSRKGKKLGSKSYQF